MDASQAMTAAEEPILLGTGPRLRWSDGGTPTEVERSWWEQGDGDSARRIMAVAPHGICGGSSSHHLPTPPGEVAHIMEQLPSENDLVVVDDFMRALDQAFPPSDKSATSATCGAVGVDRLLVGWPQSAAVRLLPHSDHPDGSSSLVLQNQQDHCRQVALMPSHGLQPKLTGLSFDIFGDIPAFSIPKNPPTFDWPFKSLSESMSPIKVECPTFEAVAADDFEISDDLAAAMSTTMAASADSTKSAKQQPHQQQQQSSSKDSHTVRRIRRSGRDVLECSMKLACRQCGALAGYGKLRGVEEMFSKPFACDLICEKCLNASAFTGPAAPGSSFASPARSRARSKFAHIDCYVCRDDIGRGGVRMVVRDLDDEQSSSSDSAWVKPDFTTTYICVPCDRDFQSCTSCGSSATGKPGKFRPREMFMEGRRTCVLPHDVRVGASSNHRFISFLLPPVSTDPASRKVQSFDLHPLVYGAPFADDQGRRPPYTGGTHQDLLNLAEDAAIQSFHWTLSFTDATIIRQHEIHSWSGLLAAAQAKSRDTHNFVMGAFRDERSARAAEGQKIRRYVNIMVHPMPAAATSFQNKQSSAAAASQSLNGNSSPPFDLLSKHGGAWLIGAVALCSWNVTTGVIDITATFPGQANLATNSVYGTVNAVCSMRIRDELAAMSHLPRPRHLVTSFRRMTKKGLGVKAAALMAQAGLIEATEYARRVGMPEEGAIEFFDSGWRGTVETQDFYVRDWVSDNLPKYIVNEIR